MFINLTSAALLLGASNPARLKAGDKIIFSPTNRVETVKVAGGFSISPTAKKFLPVNVSRHHAGKPDLRRTRPGRQSYRRRAETHQYLPRQNFLAA